MASYPLKVPDAQLSRWKDGAKERGYSLPDFVRACVEAELAEPPARAGGKRNAAKGGARVEMCEHRRRSDEYCSRCDT